MLLRAVITSRDPAGDSLHPNDMYVLFDNSLHHNEATMLKCFITDAGEPIAKSSYRVYLVMDEDSLRKRRALVRDETHFDCIEYMSIVTLNQFPAGLATCKRIHYGGTNRSNRIGDVVMPEMDTLWHLTVKQKHELHGTYRVAVGGPTPGEAGPGRGAKRKSVDSRETAFWRSRPVKLLQELRHSYQLEGVIDFTIGDGAFALDCAKARVPYFGWCLTDVHAELVKGHLIKDPLRLARGRRRRKNHP